MPSPTLEKIVKELFSPSRRIINVKEIMEVYRLNPDGSPVTPHEEGYRSIEPSDAGSLAEVKDYLEDEWEERELVGQLCSCYTDQFNPSSVEEEVAIVARIGVFVVWNTNRKGERLLHPYRLGRIRIAGHPRWREENGDDTLDDMLAERRPTADPNYRAATNGDIGKEVEFSDSRDFNRNGILKEKLKSIDVLNSDGDLPPILVFVDRLGSPWRYGRIKKES